MRMYFVKSEHDMKAAPWIGKELLIEQIGNCKNRIGGVSLWRAVVAQPKSDNFRAPL